MIRLAFLSALSLVLTSCASGPSGSGFQAALSRAKSDAVTIETARTYGDFSKARYASLTNDPETAAQSYATVIQQVPEDATIGERAVFSALMVGDVALAIELAEGLPVETLDQTELPRLILAVDAIASGEDIQSLSSLNRPWIRPFHALMARSLVAWSALESDPENALQLQSNAGGADPILNAVAKTLAALMKISQGDDDGALAALTQNWDNNIRLAVGVEAQVRLLSQAGRDEEARQLLNAFRQDIGRNPALMALSRELYAGDVAPPQRRTIQQGAALAIYAATAALAVDSDNDLPAVYFAPSVYLDPNLDAAKTLWADVLDRADRRNEAMSLLVSIPDTSPFHTSAQGQLAWVLRREGFDDEALALARETLKRTNNRNIRIQLADLLISLGRDGEGEDTLSDVIADDAARGHYDWRIYFARGAARERLGYWPPAENDLQTAIGLAPDEASLLNYLGYAWIDRGINLQDGLSLIEKAVRLKPMNGAITDSLGWAHYKLQNYDRAVFYLELAVSLEPQDSEILDHLGDAYWQVGRYTEAGYQWERALLYVEDDKDRAAITAKLSSGLSMIKAVGVRGGS
ncbi:MAG: hypothetical protein AAF613_03070 [Pseudomonadota bacterium]